MNNVDVALLRAHVEPFAADRKVNVCYAKKTRSYFSCRHHQHAMQAKKWPREGEERKRGINFHFQIMNHDEQRSKRLPLPLKLETMHDGWRLLVEVPVMKCIVGRHRNEGSLID